MIQTLQVGSGLAAPIILGNDTADGKPVSLDLTSRFSGLYLIGRTGSGKTTLENNLILQDIAHGLGCCVLSPVPDMIDDILARLPSNRQSNVHLLDLADHEHTFGLSMFQCNANDSYEVSLKTNLSLELWGKLYTESGDLAKEAPTMFETVLASSLLLIYNQNFTLAELPLILSSKDAALRLANNLPASQLAIKNWWVDLFNLKEADKEYKIGSFKRRLMAFLVDGTARRIFGQKTTIDFKRIINSPGSVLLVKLDRQRPALSSLVGATIISQIAMAAYSRSSIPENMRVPFALYCDEFQRFATPTFAELLTEVRKFKIATTIAHQFRDQLDKANKGATLNIANIVVFAVSGVDSEELAKEMSVRQDASEQAPISGNIIQTLLREAHPLQEVVDFIPWVRKLAAARNEDIDEGHTGRMGWSSASFPTTEVRLKSLPGSVCYSFSPDDTKRAMIMLNDLIYNFLRSNQSVPPLLPAGLLALLAPCLSFSNFFKIKYTNEVEKIHPTIRNAALPEAMKDEGMLATYLIDILAEQRKKFPFTAAASRLPFYYEGSLSGKTEQEDIGYISQQIAQYEILQHDLFTLSLRICLRALKRQPLRANAAVYGLPSSGQRTFQDMEKALSKELSSNSIPFTAHCRLGNTQCVIQTLELPAPTHSVNTRSFTSSYTRDNRTIDRALEDRAASLTGSSSLLPVPFEPNLPAPSPNYSPSFQQPYTQVEELPEAPPLPPPPQFTPEEEAYRIRYLHMNGQYPRYIPFTETPEQRKLRLFAQVNGYPMPDHLRLKLLGSGNTSHAGFPAPTQQNTSSQKANTKQPGRKRTRQEEDE